VSYEARRSQAQIPIESVHDFQFRLPYNVTSGQDVNNDSLFNDRPAFATDLSRPSVVVTRFVLSIRSPTSYQRTDYRSHQFSEWTRPLYAQSRLSKTFGFGPERKGTAGAQSGGVGQAVLRRIGGGPRGVEGAAVEADAAVEAVASAPRATVATV